MSLSSSVIPFTDVGVVVSTIKRNVEARLVGAMGFVDFNNDSFYTWPVVSHTPEHESD